MLVLVRFIRFEFGWILLSIVEPRSQMRWHNAMAMSLFVCLPVRLFVRLSLVKVVKSFATWQHLAESGGISYRL